MRKAGASASDVAAIGITNQRETAIVWEKSTASRSSTPSSLAEPSDSSYLRRTQGQGI